MKDHKENVIHVTENRVLGYFEMLQQQKKKPSTLWSCYSMLKKMFKIEHGVSISNYSLLNEFLKNYKAKKAIVFTAQNVNDIYQLPDDKFFFHKFCFSIALFGAMRKSELIELEFKHFNKIDENTIKVEIESSKTDQAGQGFYFLLQRNEDAARCPVRMYDQYIKLCQEANLPLQGRFWWQIRNGISNYL